MLKVTKKERHYFVFDTTTKPCKPAYLCEYILDQNNTIEPLTWYGQLKEFIKTDGKPNIYEGTEKQLRARGFLQDHVVVHVSFASSEVKMNVLDARYTFYDKIAKLGGTLGLCAQLTGGTVLTIIHLIVLIVKVCAKYCSTFQH